MCIKLMLVYFSVTKVFRTILILLRIGIETNLVKRCESIISVVPKFQMVP